MMQHGGKECIGLFALLIVLASDAHAQDWLHLEPLDGEVFVEFDGRWEDQGDVGSSSTFEFEEGVLLQQSGDILDERIATFDLEVEPRFSQGDSSGPGTQEDLDGSFLNYSGRASVLHGTDFPFSLNGGASRATGSIDGNLGSRTDFTAELRDVSLNWKNSAFPTRLIYSEQSHDETFRSGLSSTTSRRDDVLKRLRLTGRSSKMDVFLEHEDFDDKIPDRNNDQTTDRARANHRFRWGDGSLLLSRLDYFNRSEFNPNERFTLNETASIEHTEDLFSRLTYSFSDGTSGDTNTTEHAGGFGLTHYLYDNLTTTFDSAASHAETDISTEDQYQALLDSQYRKNVWEDGVLTLGAGSGLRFTDRDSEGGLVQVTDESHVVPLSGVVRLNEQFIVTDTIVVTDITGTIEFTEGVDYLVAPAGNDFTDLIIIGGGGINIGETILVSYQFEDKTSGKFITIPFQFNAGLSFGRISLFHRTRGEETSQLSGSEPGTFVNRLDSSTRLQYKWSDRDTTATFGSEFRVTRVGDDDTTGLRFDQTLFHTLGPRLSLSASANEIFTVANERNTNLITGNLSASWQPRRRLFVTPSARAWYREVTDNRSDVADQTESFFAVGLDARWTWRKVKATLSYDHNRRSGDTTDLTDDVLMIRLSRSF